jgi:hypothetical protein
VARRLATVKLQTHPGGGEGVGHVADAVEAGQSAAGYDAKLGRFYPRLARCKHRALAKVAVAHKLAVRLYLMLRQDSTYAQRCRSVVQASPSHSVVERQNRALA